jgi:hypothetical protein
VWVGQIELDFVELADQIDHLGTRRRKWLAHSRLNGIFEGQRTLPGRSMAILSAWVGHAGAALATV